MSESRPTVRRTYGKTRLGPTSSSSFLFDSSPAPISSPPSSCRLATPPNLPELDPDDAPRSSSPSCIRAATPERVRTTYEFPDDSDASSIPITNPRDATAVSVIDVKPMIPASIVTAKQSTLKGFFSALPKKRPLAERNTIPAGPSTTDPSKKASTSISIKSTQAPPGSTINVKSSMTQLHLTHLPLLHTCRECSMSYVRGGEDEGLHAKHHVKVVRGIPWEGLGRGKGKARADNDGGYKVVVDNVEFGSGREKGRGKIIMCDGSWGGAKLNEILSTVDTVLSSPHLDEPILERCKVFLFVTSTPPPSIKRQRPLPGSKSRVNVERIVSVVVAQPIKEALRVVKNEEAGEGHVDSGGGVMCDPTPLATPLGIHRLFTVPSYRSLSLARRLLDASSQHTVYGCTFDPRKGEVAFSQPTDSGRRTMERWGDGNVRVFIDDERQL